MAKNRRVNKRVLLVLVALCVLATVLGSVILILQQPKEPEAYMAEYKQAMEQSPKQYREATEAIRKAIEACGDNPNMEYYITLAELYFEQSRDDRSLTGPERQAAYGQGIGVLKDAIKKDAGCVKARRLLADYYWAVAERTSRQNESGQAYRWEDYIREVDAILKIDINDAEMYFRRGLAKARLAKTDRLLEDQVLEDLNKAVSLAPTNLSYWKSLTNFLETIGREEQADEEYKKAIAANTGKAEMYVAYSAFLQKEKKEKEAMEMILQAIQAQPDSAVGYIALATQYINDNELDKALAILQKAQDIDKTDVRIYYYRALVYRKRKELHAAAKALQDGVVVLKQSEQDPEQQGRVNSTRAWAQMNYWLAGIMMDIHDSAKDEQDKAQALAEAKNYHAELMKFGADNFSQFRIAGRIAAAEGKWEQARKDLERAMQVGFDPQIAPLLMNVYDRLGLPGLAENIAKRALTIPVFQKNTFYLIRSAEYRMNARDYMAARRLLERAQQADPENQSVKKNIQALDIREGKAGDLGAGENLNITAIQLLLIQAGDLVQREEYDKAIQIYQKILQSQPKNRGALIQLVQLLTHTRRKDEALKLLDSYIQAEPKEEMFQHLKAMMQIEEPQKRYALALEFADKIEEPLAREIQKYRVALQYGQVPDAMKYLKQAEAIDPRSPAVIEGLYRVALNDKDWSAAEALIQRLDDPEGILKPICEARLAMAKGEFETAARQFNSVLDLKPHLQGVRIWLAECYMQLSQWDNARKEYEILLTNDRKNVQAMLGLALLAERNHDIQEHDKFIKLAYLYPAGKGNPEIVKRYLRAHVDEQNLPEAIREREKIMRQMPQDLANIYRLGELYEKSRQLDKAQEMYEDVYGKTPNKIAFAPALAAFYRRADKSSMADALFGKLLDAAKEPQARAAVLMAYGSFMSSFDADAARKLLDKAIQEDPDNAKGYKSLNMFLAQQAFDLARKGQLDASQAKWKEAIDVLLKALKLEPDDITTRRVLYRQYTDAGEYSQATSGYQTLLNENPNDVLGMVGMGLVYLRQDELDKAMKELNHALELDPNNADAYVLRSEIHQARGDLRAAIKDMVAAEQFTSNVTLQMDLARLNEAIGNMNEAERVYDTLIAKYPKYRQAYVNLVSLYGRQEKWSSMEHVIGIARTHFPEDPWFLVAMANMRKQQSEPAKQIAILQDAVKIAPNSIPTIRSYLLALVGNGQYDEVRKESAKYIAHPEQEAGIRAIMAMAAAKEAPNTDAGLPEFLKAIQAAKNDEDIQFACQLMSQAYGSEKISSHAAEIIKARPDTWLIYTMLADAFSDQKTPQFAQAEQMLQKALSLSKAIPAQMQVFSRLGLLYDRMQQSNKSIEAYEKVLSLSPNSTMALNNLAYMYANRLNQPDKALRLIEKAMRIQPGDMNLVDTYAWTLAKKGEYDKALANLRDIIQRGATSVDTLYHMGFVLEKMGDLEGALGYYRRAIESIRGQSDHPLQEPLATARERVEAALKNKESRS